MVDAASITANNLLENLENVPKENPVDCGAKELTVGEAGGGITR
jgi:hypothetical protein